MIISEPGERVGKTGKPGSTYWIANPGVVATAVRVDGLLISNTFEGMGS